MRLTDRASRVALSLSRIDLSILFDAAFATSRESIQNLISTLRSSTQLRAGVDQESWRLSKRAVNALFAP